MFPFKKAVDNKVKMVMIGHIAMPGLDDSNVPASHSKKIVSDLLIKEWGFKSVYFDDDTFNVNKRRIAAFCNELIRRGLTVPWAAMSRADLVDEKLLKIMRQSGVQALKFGIESADQNAVDNMEKSLNLTKAVQNIRLTHNHGIKTHLSFMFGLPGESRESCEKTLQMAKDLNPESLQFTVAAPFPGSKFMDHLEEVKQL